MAAPGEFCCQPGPTVASRLTEAHIQAQAQLRALIAGAVGTAWQGLGSWDKADVPRFLNAAVPVVLAGQRHSVNLTNAYIARSLDRGPLPLDLTALTGAALRNGTPPQEVYRRPFVDVWGALKSGQVFEDAVAKGLARASSSAEMDVQMAMRATANTVGEADDGIYGYIRVADGGACEFCQAVDGAYIKFADAMPLHNRCGCGLEPLTAPHPRAARLPSGVAVHEHGELGPMLGSPDHDFTTTSQLK